MPARPTRRADRRAEPAPARGTEAPITAHKGYVCADLDTFVMDNSDTKKEAVSRTYQGVDGYTPIALYLGNEGWNLGLGTRGFTTRRWRPSISSSARSRACAGCAPPMRSCCGGPTAASTAPDCCSRWPTSAIAGPSSGVRSITSPSGIRAARTRTAWVARAEAAGVFEEVRAGKRVGLLDLKIERAWKKAKRIAAPGGAGDRAHDRQEGPAPAHPEIEIEGWWTSLDVAMADVIELYKHHGTHEQFHSEIKTDLDLERLPSGGSIPTTRSCIWPRSPTTPALIGQLGLTGDISPIRHPAKRRRIKTVLQEVMYRAAKFVEHARRLVLDFRTRRRRACEGVHHGAGATVRGGFAVMQIRRGILESRPFRCGERATAAREQENDVAHPPQARLAGAPSRERTALGAAVELRSGVRQREKSCAGARGAGAR